MVKFVMRVNQQRTAYITKEIVENLGHHSTMMPNAKAVVIYPSARLDNAIWKLHSRDFKSLWIV